MAHIGHCVGEFLGGRLNACQHSRAEEHLRVCAHCRLLLARERHRLRLLAAVPQPSDDLAQRILQRTQCLNTPGNEELRLPYRVRRRAKSALAAGTGAAVVALLGGAYLAGADTGEKTAPPQPSMAAVGLTSHWPVENPAAMPPQPGSAQPATAVESTDLDSLKSAGWACPELASMGFSLRSAEGFVLAGVPTLELILSNGANSVRVYEQRPQQGSAAGGSGVPLNAMTGHDAAADGFTPLSSGGVQMWLHQGSPWQVIFRQEDETYTVSTDLPAAALERMTAAINAPSGTSGRPAGGPPANVASGMGSGTSGTGNQENQNDWSSRIMRGLARFVSFS